MVNLKPFPTNSQQNKLECFNTVGLILQDQIYLNKNDQFLQFDINDIKQINLKKERDLKNNYSLFVMSCALVYSTSLLENSIGQNYKLVFFLLSSVLLLFSFFKKNYHYTILLITAHYHLTSIIIKDNSKDQACEFISLTKRKIKENNIYQKAS